MRRVLLFIATSIDGYIATANHDISFLKIVEKEGEDYGYNNFIKHIDTVIIGRKTYEYVANTIGEEHYAKGDNNVYVITHQNLPAKEKIVFYNKNIKTLIQELQSKEGKDIYCDGGAQVINELLQHDLIDEMTISIIPILLGGGIRLFKDGRPQQHFELVHTNSYETGLVQMTYRRKR